MANRKYNHIGRIKGLQSALIKSLHPGTIIQFQYIGKNIFDKKPIVLVLWNDYTESKIHGINLNYLTEFKIKMLFEEIMEVKGNVVVEEDKFKKHRQFETTDINTRHIHTSDDNLPYRNLLKDPYTRIKLPTYKENRGGNPLSKAEAIKQMDRLYEKKLKRIIKKHDIYRSYFQNKMNNIKVVTYDIEGLLK